MKHIIVLITSILCTGCLTKKAVFPGDGFLGPELRKTLFTNRAELVELSVLDSETSFFRLESGVNLAVSKNEQELVFVSVKLKFPSGLSNYYNGLVDVLGGMLALEINDTLAGGIDERIYRLQVDQEGSFNKNSAGSLTVSLYCEKVEFDQIFTKILRTLHYPKMEMRFFKETLAVRQANLELVRQTPTLLAFRYWNRFKSGDEVPTSFYADVENEGHFLATLSLGEVKRAHRYLIGGEWGDVVVAGPVTAEKVYERIEAEWGEWKPLYVGKSLMASPRLKTRGGLLKIVVPEQSSSILYAGYRFPSLEVDSGLRILAAYYWNERASVRIVNEVEDGCLVVPGFQDRWGDLGQDVIGFQLECAIGSEPLSSIDHYAKAALFKVPLSQKSFRNLKNELFEAWNHRLEVYQNRMSLVQEALSTNRSIFFLQDLMDEVEQVSLADFSNYLDKLLVEDQRYVLLAKGQRKAAPRISH